MDLEEEESGLGAFIRLDECARNLDKVVFARRGMFVVVVVVFFFFFFFPASSFGFDYVFVCLFGLLCFFYCAGVWWQVAFSEAAGGGEARSTWRAVARARAADGTAREALGVGEGRGCDAHAARREALLRAVAEAERAAVLRLHEATGGQAAAAGRGGTTENESSTNTSKTSLRSAASRSGTSTAPPVPTAQPKQKEEDRQQADDEAAEEARAAKEEAERLALAEARRLEQRKQKEQEEEIERLRIEQEEEEERIRIEQEEEEERKKEEEKKQEEEKKKAEEKKRAEEEAAASAAAAAASAASAAAASASGPPSPAPRGSTSPAPVVKRMASAEKLGTAPQALDSPSQTRKAPTAPGPPAPAARPKAIAAKSAPPAVQQPIPVPSIVPRSAPVPTSTAKGPVRSPVTAAAPALRSSAPVASPPPANPPSGERKQLSLSSRKNVKQFQPTFAEHAERLMDALGLSLQIQSKVEWTSLADVCDDSGFKNMCGEIFFDKVMGGLVGNLLKLSPAGREALAEGWTSGGISLKFDDAQDTQWSSRLTDEGDLELTSRGEPWQDLGQVGADLVEELGAAPDAAIGASSGVASASPAAVAVAPAAPIAAKSALEQNVAAFGRAFSEHAAAMQSAADLPMLPTHNVNFEELNGHLAKLGKADTAGELFLSTIVGALARNVGTLCKKRLVAGVLRNLWGTGVISLTLNEQQKDPWMTQLLRGACVISVRPSALLSSPEVVGRHMLDLAVEGDSGLPVLSAQSMQDHETEILDLLERLRVASGLTVSVVADVDFFEVTMLVNALGPEWEHQVGRVWVAILTSLVTQMELVALQQDALEIMANLWNNAVLKLAFDDTLDEGMWQCDFVEGDLILYSNPRGIHMAEQVGEDLADRVFN